MRRFCIVVTILAAACGSDTTRPPSSPNGTDAVEPITGRERIGWNQSARDAAELSTLQYAVYVDNVRYVMADASCTTSPEPSGFLCTAALPPLTNGVHTLEIVSFVQTAEGIVESSRAAPLRVSVAAMTAPSELWGTGDTETTTDGITLRAEKLAEGLSSPVAAAFADDGTLFIAERTGTIKVFTEARGELGEALRLGTGADDAAAQILSIALDPKYAQSRFAFVVQAIPAERGTTLQVVRYRAVEGRLAERAVLFEMPAAGPPAAASAAMRFGPDDKLYLASGAADGTGRLTRLNADGSMPRDQIGTAPAIATGIETVRGMAWDPRSRIVWIADDGESDAHLSALSLTPVPVRAVPRVRKRIAGRAGSLEFYRSDAQPSMKGDALLASADGYIARFRIAPDDPARIEWIANLFDRHAGAIRVVAVSPDGVVYFCTDSALGRLAFVR
jgi:glucose/arabinose dehydrogenase